MAVESERVLILCKTYPSPSGKYVETSCVAGMRPDGRLIRLYPVPFRLIRDEMQFKKWQWIEAKVAKARNDHRPESHRLLIDTIVCDDHPVSTRRNWAERRGFLDRCDVSVCFDEIEEQRNSNGRSLALLRPKNVLSLDIIPAKEADWTADELAKLLQAQTQLELFSDAEAAADVATLRKLPFSFYYTYECVDESGNSHVYKHKIVDWEVGALYWRCVQRYGDGWETKFRMKMENQLPEADLMFLMGTIHRFPDQWLIVSLIYPPHRMQDAQASLF